MDHIGKPAVFLDRDGTLIEDRGIVKDLTQAVFFPFTIEALKKLQKHFLLFMVTNQSWIASGQLTRQEVDAVNEGLVAVLAREGIKLQAVYVCPHAKEDGCRCRKPKDYFLRLAEKDFHVDLSSSYSVGDHLFDYHLSQNTGGKGAFLLTGHGEKHRQDCPDLHRIFSGLDEAADWMIADFLNKDESGTIAAAANAVRRGELVVFPTETVYGLGADATNAEAVLKIFALKERPHFDPLIVHIHELSQLSAVCKSIGEKADALIKAFWPGPLTLVLPKAPGIPDQVTSNLPTVGVRMPSHPVARVFLEKCGVPVAAPSANKFGYVSPTEAGHVQALRDGVAAILDGGLSRCGIESTIVSLQTAEPVILRQGVVTKSMIEAVIGPVTVMTRSSSRPEAPGMLVSHYSPRAKVHLDPSGLPEGHEVQVFLRFKKEPPCEGFSVYELSGSGTLEEAAANLYRGLRYADEIGAKGVSCYLFDEEGIGAALNDKLRRAAAAE